MYFTWTQDKINAPSNADVKNTKQVSIIVLHCDVLEQVITVTTCVMSDPQEQ